MDSQHFIYFQTNIWLTTKSKRFQPVSNMTPGRAEEKLFVSDVEIEKMVNFTVLETALVNNLDSFHLDSWIFLTAIPSILAIILVNFSSILFIRKKEKTLVNKLLLLDCYANMVLTFINVINQLSILESTFLCSLMTIVYGR